MPLMRNMTFATQALGISCGALPLTTVWLPKIKEILAVCGRRNLLAESNIFLTYTVNLIIRQT
jgi:hypothetical protein